MFPLLQPDRHWGCRLNDRLTWHGLQAILMQNELLQILILVDKGAEIVQFLYKPLDVDFLWRAPNVLRDPSRFVPAGGSQTTPFFDHWSGGWFEVVPNGGPACEYKGAPLGFYAETVNVPWEYQIVDDRPDRVQVALWVKTYRMPFLLQKTLTLESGRAALYIEERLTNEGHERLDFMWGHHPVVGAPFLDESCRLSAPVCRVEVLHDEDGPDYRMGLHQVGRWPVIDNRDGAPLDLRLVPPPSSRTMDNCYLSGFNEGWVAIHSARRKIGFGLAWNAEVFRYVWLWQALGGGLGYPWFGRTYNLGLEPWSSFPCAGLNAAVERGTALQIAAGQSIDTWLTATAFVGDRDVCHIGRDGAVTNEE
ncbi:MAG TPA: aldose 1-epimerase [Aggregatilineales bacterium]|nr:aldose 1-epimerase [Aggregatilineales bacterium]